jgi:hypothetical protein
MDNIDFDKLYDMAYAITNLRRLHDDASYVNLNIFLALHL